MARILVADDSIVAQQSYRQMLEFLGYEVVICKDGVTAVNSFRECRPDLVILDIDMPEMNGFDACREMRKLPESLAVPIIMVSVGDSEEDIVNGLNAGANDYLLKPVKEPHLIAKLKTFLKFSIVHREDLDLVRNHVEFAGRYTINRLLGHGAHSIVFLARDKDTGMDVAVKLITTPDIQDFAETFIQTAAKLKNISSKNVLKIYDFGQYAGRLYLILEYADKGELATELKHHKLSEKEALKLGLDIIRGLKELDKNGIIHFDIKPENIMFAGSDYKLADFGIAVQRETRTVPIKSEIWSTTAYLSPEYLDDSTAVSIKSDIYSLGVTLYESVTGENPFKSEKLTVSMFKQMNLIPPSIKNFDPKITEYFSDTLDAMLDKNPEKRPPLDELEEIFTNIINYLETTTVEERRPHEENLAQASLKLRAELDELTQATWPAASRKKTRKRTSLRIALLRFGIYMAMLFLSIIVLASTVAGYLFYTKLLDRSEISPPGALSTVICRKCGIQYETMVVDINEMKCFKCEGSLSYRQRCNECGFEFPYRQYELGTDESAKDCVKRELDLNRCPECGSVNTSAAPTSIEKRLPGISR